MRSGPDREQCLAKRREILRSPAHLVEIDLIRAGEPLPADDRPTCTYSVMVSRAEGRPRAGFWPIGLKDRLPVVPIPLRAPHADARLDLKGLLDRVHDAAGYQYYIYDGAPSPALSAEDLAWARQNAPRSAP